MSEDQNNQNQNNQKAPKSGSDLLRQIEDKNLTGEIGKLRKQLEEKVPLREKARETVAQLDDEISDLVFKIDEILEKKKNIR